MSAAGDLKAWMPDVYRPWEQGMLSSDAQLPELLGEASVLVCVTLLKPSGDTPVPLASEQGTSYSSFLYSRQIAGIVNGRRLGLSLSYSCHLQGKS